eukprot:CAMPEP_0167741656 /NCGR_PEP_ID=MMETSP0110_2-20121227/980_1 /TAXON_ID=629695 /ORGANISM="Gymnochlora sp., Strain CCMP2014" /LENGTH=207 /DNA_ID=CAMNT_0007625737 /DNA_START=66 /DNA_END=689 /DNA_ORIENTATION=+
MATIAFALMFWSAQGSLTTRMAQIQPLRVRSFSSRSKDAQLKVSAEEDSTGRTKWSVDVQNENAERLESVKAAIVGAVAGSLVAAPIALLSPNRLTPQWEFDHDALAATLALGALVYRYAVREDPNPMLKQGAAGAFAITRTLALLQVSEDCTSLPLTCGAPLGFANWDMILKGSFIALESFAAFGGMAVALEFLFEKDLLRRFPSK